MKVRNQLESLSDECETLCRCDKFVGPNTGNPNFRLIYTGVGTYEQGNGYAIVGLNPAGDETDADTDDPNRPFREKGYSAYLDDDWRGAGEGQDAFQRRVQGIAMIMTGATPSEAVSAIKNPKATPMARIGSNATEFLRNTPSSNIVPFRHSRQAKVPPKLWNRGQQIGWELLCLAQPKPNYILTLANSIDAPKYPIWRTILSNSGQQGIPDFEAVVNQGAKRMYRELRLTQGPLAGATLIGLPAVVRSNSIERVMLPLFKVLSKRLQHHGVHA